MAVFRLEIEARAGLPDALAGETAERLHAWLGLAPARIRTRKLYHFELDVDGAEAQRIAGALVDPVAEQGALGVLSDGAPPADWVLTIGLLPGVTDSVGKSVKRAAEDCLGRALSGRVYTSTMYLFWGLERTEVQRAADEVLFNPLIQKAKLEQPPRAVDLDVPRPGSEDVPSVATVDLRAADDAELERISRDGLLALNLTEMRAIRDHFGGLGRNPTDAELECLAQTWSEHCKHKIFAAPIEYVDPDGKRSRIEEGLFKRYIRETTESVAAKRRQRALDPEDAPFLVSVFHDNAGVVRFTDEDHLVYKVETHNSPSALDPYGGALTGIVGVNRDSFGTGLGADLLTNVWGYCFGPPDWRERVPPGLMHPRRIREGVHAGVVDGGNQSGIPYSRGWELFEHRYVGKPLVFCGTVAVMPREVAGHPTHRKRTEVGDKVVMVGGRIGKDGIHGATFSSGELDERAPVQAVQLGDPITQKLMFDMLTEARDLGLYRGMTDNGAGGLSSSVGEMAEATGGARIDLAAAPLKYPGLAPWEILVSEAQERMTVAVPPEHLEEFLALAERREVEATVLGEFTDSGRFEVLYGTSIVVDLELEFLHEGVPKVVLEARWEPGADSGGARDEDARALHQPVDDQLLSVLAMPEFGGVTAYARRYDHEVKALSVVKPLLGMHENIPSTATVMRARHKRREGVVLGEGIHPFYSDIDTLAMAHACVDEGVRRVLCAGADIDRSSALDNFCWPDPIESQKTPDGAHKLAQLVRCCQGLREACETYGLPLISGKDSMKNDAVLGGVKISIPPTLLVSVMGQMEDVERALTLEPRAVGDLVYVLGGTRDELGGSSWARQTGCRSSQVPRTDLAANLARYRAFVTARDAGLVRSAHVLSRGGLAVALAQLAMASDLGIDCRLDGLDAELKPANLLFSETTGRMLVTVAPEHAEAFERALQGHAAARIGAIAPPRAGRGWLRVAQGQDVFMDLDATRLTEAFQGDDVA